MDKHPSYAVLSPIILKYPGSAGALFQTYNDIVHGQQWRDVSVVDLGPVCARAAVTGRKLSGETDELLHIVPCSLTEQLSFEFFQKAFKALTDPPAIYLAINSDDSSIVYYKISTGFVKPSS